MTTKPPHLDDLQTLRRATGSLLLSGSLAVGLTTYWLGSGMANTASASAATADTTSVDDQGWTQAAPQATYPAQPQQSPRGLSRGS
ncbi:hypothetical protein [Deinococcus sp.]|uniref:hypothetical protein n=1 Tax=Deinococcus sp. TaxID=47478 RepID=UPI002869876C|nr:hypothetical protein [Deinococcus sp.]